MTQTPDGTRPLILGSTSRYRRELLERLKLRFDVAAPEVDEAPLPGEAPHALALRLAIAKAQAVAARHPHAIVIGSDQVADLAGEPLGKPGTHDKAVRQLARMSGQTVVFHTAVAVVCRESGSRKPGWPPCACAFARSRRTRSSATCKPNALTTARAAPKAKDWVSRCWTPSTATTPRPSSACR